MFNLSNYGSTWLANSYIFNLTNSGSLLSVSPEQVVMSCSTQYQIANFTDTDYIAYSSNAGSSWTYITTSPTPINARSVAISSSGQYQTMLFSRSTSSESVILVSNNFNSTRTIITPNFTDLYCIAMSASGKYQFVSNGSQNLYISSNYGTSFQSVNVTSNTSLYGNAGNLSRQGIAVSASGQIVSTYSAPSLGSKTYFFTSFDYGNSWTRIECSLTVTGGLSIAMSSSGQYQLCVVYTTIVFLSIDFGQSWNQLPTFTGYSLKDSYVSSAGQYMAIGTTTNAVHISTNFGATWTAKTVGISGGSGFSSVQMSGDGSYILAAQRVANGTTYYSTNI